MATELEKSESKTNNGWFLLCRSRNIYVEDGKTCFTPFKCSLIDVAKARVLPSIIPEMPPEACRLSTSGVISNSFIFVMGGRCVCEMECPFHDGTYHMHCTVHYLNLNEMQWKLAPNLSVARGAPDVIDFGDGKVFVCGGLRGGFNAQPHLIEFTDWGKGGGKLKKKKGMDTSANANNNADKDHCWKPLHLPSDLGLKKNVRSVSKPVLDANRRRIIMHFPGSDNLHAYYPDTNTWRCLDYNFCVKDWSHYSVVVDDHDVLYSLRCTMTFDELSDRDVNPGKAIPHSLHAFDLISNTWLKVSWSGQNKLPFVKIFGSLLFHMGHGKLCIVNPFTMLECTKITLTTLCLRKTSNGEIIAEKEPSKSLCVDGYFDDITHLPQEAMEKIRNGNHANYI